MRGSYSSGAEQRLALGLESKIMTHDGCEGSFCDLLSRINHYASAFGPERRMNGGEKDQKLSTKWLGIAHARFCLGESFQKSFGSGRQLNS